MIFPITLLFVCVVSGLSTLTGIQLHFEDLWITDVNASFYTKVVTLSMVVFSISYFGVFYLAGF